VVEAVRAVETVSPWCPISRVGGASGTLGCLVRVDDDDHAVYLVTAAHVVLAPGARPDDLILQPGSDLGGTESSSGLARLHTWTKLVATPTGFPNKADAAVARLIDPSSVSREIPAIGTPAGH